LGATVVIDDEAVVDAEDGDVQGREDTKHVFGDEAIKK
jgi:hypothetical protein